MGQLLSGRCGEQTPVGIHLIVKTFRT